MKSQIKKLKALEGLNDKINRMENNKKKREKNL